MVQGCDLNILDMKGPGVSKSIKVAVPTEEQKRLAQLSHIERIDTLEDSIIQRMVEITNHSYEDCAMELAGANMDMESAITNIIEGNCEGWETTKKRVRPEKKVPPPENADAKPKRSSSKPERGRHNKSEDSRNHDSADRSRSVRSTRGSSVGTRGSSVGTRGTSVGTRGTISSRGRGGKRQLPPRMDRNRGSYPDDTRNNQRDSYRSSGGRSNGSYRHNNRGAKRPTASEPEHDWGEGAEEATTNYSAEWTEDNSGGWPTEETPATLGGWGGDATETAWTEAADKEQRQPVPSPAPVVTTAPMPDTTASSWSETEVVTNGGQYNVTPTRATPELTHKRPAYTQAFNNSLSSMLTSTDFSSTSTSFSFGFSQPQSSVSSDYNTRHEQAPGGSSLLNIQEAFNKSNNMASGRKISVEQLFQMHEKSNGGNIPVIEERATPASPPTSSTSSNNSGRKSKRLQRTIPSEPVEMPGNTIESLDVQFGSIGFLDNTEEDLLVTAVEKTPATKSDAATSTTPHAENSDGIPGIHQLSNEDARQLQSTPTTANQPSPPRQQPIYQPNVSHPVATTQQMQSSHQVSPAHHQGPPAHHQVSPAHHQGPPAHHQVSPAHHQGPPAHQVPSTHNVSSVHQAPSLHQSTTSHQSHSSMHPSASLGAAAPPNLPPPNLDNIRTANNLITTHSLPEEEVVQGSFSVGLATQQHHSKKTLPPGVYPTANLRTSLYYNDNTAQHHQHQHQPQHHPSIQQHQQTMQHQQAQVSQHQQMTSYDMSRYYNNTSSGNFDIHHQQQQQQQQQQQRQAQQVQQHQQQENSFTSQEKHQQQQQQHYRPSELQQLSSASLQPPHVGSGITSGISSTTAAAPTGYPPLLGHYYPHPIHPYPNNLYANYYHPFNPALNFAQTQKQTHSVPSYPATNTFGSSSDSGTSPFGQYEDYKEQLYAPAATTKHHTISHIPVTSSNDYSKMMTDKSMFNMGYMFPNYIQQFQQGQGQQAALLQQSSIQAQQRGMEQARNQAATTPKHYWSHR